MVYNAVYSVESQPTFRRNTSLLATCFTLVSCLDYSATLNMEATCSSETSVDFHGLHGVISQKMELFITTAMKTSDPTTLMTTSLFYGSAIGIFPSTHP
jgi:hypothetical protein